MAEQKRQKLVNNLLVVAEKSGTVCQVVGDTANYLFLPKEGTGNIRMLYNDDAQARWSIAVNPVSGGDVEEFHFLDSQSAINAFKLVQAYYRLVVCENCNNF